MRLGSKLFFALVSSCAVLAGCGHALGNGSAVLPADAIQSAARRPAGVDTPVSARAAVAAPGSSAWTYMGQDSFIGDYQTPTDAIATNGDLISVGAGPAPT